MLNFYSFLVLYNIRVPVVSDLCLLGVEGISEQVATYLLLAADYLVKGLKEDMFSITYLKQLLSVIGRFQKYFLIRCVS